MTAPLAVVWRPATRAAGDGALEEIALVSQCPDMTPVKLREAEKSIDRAKHKLTWHLHG